MKIFIVDDDPFARSFAKAPLEGEGIEIREFESGDACLAAIGEAPDIVLLDVEMPGAGGIETCRAIRAAGHSDIEVIFASVHDDIDIRLSAHAVSGNDFIVKPYVQKDLAEKVEVAKRAVLARREVAEHMAAQRSAAAGPITSGEVTALVTFQLYAQVCWTFEELGVALSRALGECGLPGFIALRDGGENYCYSSQGELTALEASIPDHSGGVDSIFHFHDRFAIQYPHVVFMIPHASPDVYEEASRLYSHLTVLVGIAEARFSALSYQARCRARARSVMEAIEDFEKEMEGIPDRRGMPASATLKKRLIEAVSD